MEEKKSHYECDECGSTWIIHHDNYDDVTFCPFCGLDLEEPYEKEEENLLDGWDDPDDDKYE